MIFDKYCNFLYTLYIIFYSKAIDIPVACSAGLLAKRNPRNYFTIYAHGILH
jgi:hypothetical protein